MLSILPAYFCCLSTDQRLSFRFCAYRSWGVVGAAFPRQPVMTGAWWGWSVLTEEGWGRADAVWLSSWADVCLSGVLGVVRCTLWVLPLHLNSVCKAGPQLAHSLMHTEDDQRFYFCFSVFVSMSWDEMSVFLHRSLQKNVVIKPTKKYRILLKVSLVLFHSLVKLNNFSDLST